jgi:hypothetical protein
VTDLALFGRRGVDEMSRPRSQWSSLAFAAVASSAVAVVALTLGWRGSDLPAQVYRVELFRRYGLVVWDSQWFGGYPTFGYSVLSPVIGAVAGPLWLGACSGVFSAALFDRIVHRAISPASRIGTLWFALGTVTNLAVGRITFAFGVAVALAAIYAMQRRWTTLGLACAIACPLASPLAGLFLAIGAAAWGIAQPTRRHVAAAVAAAASAPILIIAVLYPSGGSYPFSTFALVWDLSVCAAFLWLMPRRYATARWAAVLYGAVVIAAFFVHSPLGENVSRFGQYAAGPLLLCALAPRRRAILVVVAVPLLVWQWFPALDAVTGAPHDPSTQRTYYQPLLGFLASVPPSVGRVEVPSTYRHWEAAYLAPQVPLARGWERQLDIGYNAIFYDGTLTANTYQHWLAMNGVKYVALPDARLDSSSTREKAVILGGPSYLKPVWHNAHWQVWQFSDYHGLVDGPATVLSMRPDSFTLRVDAPGQLTVHIHASPHWSVQRNGCIEDNADGWTHIQTTRAGTMHVTQALRGTPCL